MEEMKQKYLQPCKKNIISGEFQSNSVIRPSAVVGSFD